MVETSEEVGKKAAEEGRINEELVKSKLDNWESDKEASEWIKFILKDYKITSKQVQKIKFEKNQERDVVDVIGTIILNKENLNFGLSLVKQNLDGYNHLNRRDVEDYAKEFILSKLTVNGLKKYCGVTGFSPFDEYNNGKITRENYNNLRDIPEKISHKEGNGRYFFDELTADEQSSIIRDFTDKQNDILSFILKGKSNPNARFIIITREKDNQNYDYHIDTTINMISRAKGKVKKTERGSFKIKDYITIQRKGGTWGAHQLQFKWKNIFPN